MLQFLYDTALINANYAKTMWDGSWYKPGQNTTNCSFRVNADNTLTYPDGHKEEIISSDMCMDNFGDCYDMIPNSPYARTKKTLEFYKKTKIPNGNTIQDSKQVLTVIVVPSGSEVRFERGEMFSYRSICLEGGIVREQKVIETGEDITETTSRSAAIFETVYNEKTIWPNFNFKYKTGNYVRPTSPYYGYDRWKADPMTEQFKSDGGDPYFTLNHSGIHVYSGKVWAENCA